MMRTVILLILLAAGSSAFAQDSRTATEPVFPQVCTTLAAQLTLSGGEPSSETAFDTGRIEAALNSCPSGQEVELAVSGGNNAFLLQPVTLSTGMNLIVDGGVTVFASRNPADYQSAPPSSSVDTCGTLGTNNNGCLPLISVWIKTTQMSNIGIYGYGVIDGRGGDKLVVNGSPSGQSWWNVAASKPMDGSSHQNNPTLVYANAASNVTMYRSPC